MKKVLVSGIVVLITVAAAGVFFINKIKNKKTLPENNE